MEQFGYITFKSVSFAMKFETSIKNYEIKIKIIPVPRSISSSCGLCIRFNIEDMNNLMQIIGTEHLEYDHIFSNI